MLSDPKNDGGGGGDDGVITMEQAFHWAVYIYLFKPCHNPVMMDTLIIPVV